MSEPNNTPLHLVIARTVAGAGVMLVSSGAAMIYPPAGLIVAGICLLVIGIGALR